MQHDVVSDSIMTWTDSLLVHILSTVCAVMGYCTKVQLLQQRSA